MSWLNETADLWAGGKFDKCETHEHHDTHLLNLKVRGVSLPDWPAVPNSLACPMALNVFDWHTYENTTGYCTGDDEVSKTIDYHGMWEGYETVMVLDILRNADRGYVLDFGSHLGWFSMLGAITGHDVLAVDADVEHLAVLQQNATANRVEVVGCRAWIGSETKPATCADQQIRFVKSDLEGADDHVVRVLEQSLRAGKVDYLMMEVSPVFADHYLDTAMWLGDCGYRAYLVPDKIDGDPERFASHPLESVKRRPLTFDHFLDAIGDQRTVLFGLDLP